MKRPSYYSVTPALFTLLLFFVLIALMILSLTLGRYPVPFGEVVRIVFTSFPINADGDYTNAPWVVVEFVRLPRILLVTLCGMGLALSGATMQGVFRNPLVGLSGLRSQACRPAHRHYALLAVAWARWFGLWLRASRPLRRLQSRQTCRTHQHAWTCSLRRDCRRVLRSCRRAITDARRSNGETPLHRLLAAGTLLMALRWRINLLSLGGDDAHALGVNVEVLRWSLMRLVALLVAAQVSVSGGVGWVGLIVPHLAGLEHTRLLPTAAFLGGIYLLAMDDIAHSATEQEIPIGLLPSVIGTPIFALQFWKTQSKGSAQD